MTSVRTLLGELISYWRERVFNNHLTWGSGMLESHFVVVFCGYKTTGKSYYF